MPFSQKEKPESIGSRRELDLQGLKCPLPALKTAAALDRLTRGEVLCVLATDPLAAIDIPHAVRERGDELLEVRSAGRATMFLIRRNS